ncbi:MAG: O-methyltransferase [Sciscionella sp.]
MPGTAPSASSAAASAAYVEDFLVEDEVMSTAREWGHQLGATPVSRSSGATLRLLAAVLRARAVVEIGTGAGVSGLYLLAGMTADGVLTSIDVEPEHQRTARRSFREAGYPGGRARLIMGRALDVLPRLTDSGYDMVFVDAAKVEYPQYHEHGVQLLRPGGVIVFDSTLAEGRVADPARRDPETVALRELTRAVREDERLCPALLPIGDGLLVAVKLATPSTEASAASRP